MTALCLCNNISRHIKITSVVLNFEFVTENFVAISSVKISVLDFEFRDGN